MALGSPAFLDLSEVCLQRDVSEPSVWRSASAEAKRRVGPMACGIGSPFVLLMMGLAFRNMESFSENGDKRRLSESEATGT